MRNNTLNFDQDIVTDRRNLSRYR